jgi:hypothetical protein
VSNCISGNAETEKRVPPASNRVASGCADAGPAGPTDTASSKRPMITLRKFNGFLLFMLFAAAEENAKWRYASYQRMAALEYKSKE